jgi:hypothetical protein
MAADAWHIGNAATDSDDHRGWFVGRFIDDDLHHSEDVMIKWGVHPNGDRRAEWQGDEHRTTVALLVKGRFRMTLSTASHVLEREGAYAMWGPSGPPRVVQQGGAARAGGRRNRWGRSQGRPCSIPDPTTVLGPRRPTQPGPKETTAGTAELSPMHVLADCSTTPSESAC